MQNHWLLSLSGMIAAIWMLAGIIIVSHMLPSYSHTTNTLSELGARGKPTERIHPFINNYPIGILYILFGVYLFVFPKSFLPAHLVGILITLHGFSHILAGAFPCDADLNVARFSPSPSHKIHTLAGLVMQLTLLVATFFLFFSSSSTPSWLRWFSLACAATSVLFFSLIFTKNAPLGLYQRLSFSPLALWVAILSWLSYANS